MDEKHYTQLTLVRDHRSVEIRLNRPEVANAVNEAMHRELACVFADLAHDDSIDLIILTGEGDAFCAGGDLAYLNQMLTESGAFEHSLQDGKAVLKSLVDLDKPVIAKVNGDAIGFGATLALFCDIVVASETARFSDPHVRIGLAAGDGGALIWPLLIGGAQARKLLLTGDMLTAAEARSLGLIADVVARAELDAAVDALKTKILRNPARGVRLTKAALNILLKRDLTAHIDQSFTYELLSFQSQETRDRLTRAIQKSQAGA